MDVAIPTCSRCAVLATGPVSIYRRVWRVTCEFGVAFLDSRPSARQTTDRHECVTTRENRVESTQLGSCRVHATGPRGTRGRALSRTYKSVVRRQWVIS